MNATFIFWMIVASVIGAVLYNTYRGSKRPSVKTANALPYSFPKIKFLGENGMAWKLPLAAAAAAFILFYSWESTPLGKRLVQVLGTEYADLFDTLVKGPMLLLVAILLYLSWGKKEGTGGKGGDSSINLTAVLIAALVAMIVVGGVGYVTLEIDERVNSNTNLPAVDLRKVPVGGSVEFMMELNNTVPVWYRTVHVNEPGEGSYWACFEVVNKDSYDKVIMFTTLAGAGTNENIVGLTEDTQAYLYRTYGFIRLKVRVTLVRAWDNPCTNVL